MKKLLAFATIAALLCGCESDPGVASLDDGDVATMNFSITNTDDIGVGEEIGIYIFDQSGETIEGKENLRYVVGEDGVLTPSSDDDIFYRNASVARTYHAYYPYDESLSSPIVNINTADQTNTAAYAKRSCLIADNTSYGVAFEMGYIPNVYRIKFTTAESGITSFDASNITSVKYCSSYTESNYSLSNFDAETSSFTHVDGSVKDLVMEDDGDEDPLTYRVAVIPDFGIPSQHIVKVVYNDGGSIYSKDLSWDGVEPTDDYIETPLNFSDASSSAIPDGITISGTPTGNLDVIGTATLSADLTTTGSGEVDESSFTIKWISDKPLVVSVDDSGNITALREGTAKITASVEALSLTSTEVEITVNALEPFSYTEFLTDGKYETIVPSSNEWVINDEEITGLSSGWTEVKAAIVKYAESYEDEELSITFPNMTKNLRASALAFTEGAANPIVALSFPEHTNAIASGSLAYMPNLKTIYAPKVTKVNSEFIGCTSLVSVEVATADGYSLSEFADPSFATTTGETYCDYKLIVGGNVTTGITIDSNNKTLSDGTKTYTFSDIQVEDNWANTIALSCSKTTNFVDNEDNTYTLTMSVDDADLTLTATTNYQGSESTSAVNWTIESGDDPTGCLSVNGGVLTATQAGTATVVATHTEDSSLVASCEVTILTASEPASIAINETTQSYEAGSTTKLTVTLKDSTSNEIDTSKYTINWSSNTPATVYIDDDGTIICYEVGTAQITASIDGYDSVTAATLDLTVTALQSFSMIEFAAGGKYETYPPYSTYWEITETTFADAAQATLLRSNIIEYTELNPGKELTINFSNLTVMRSSALSFGTGDDCSALVKLLFPVATRFASGGVANITSLKSVYAPKLTQLESGFIGCSALESVEVATDEGSNFASVANDGFSQTSGDYTCSYQLIIGSSVGSGVTINESDSKLTVSDTTYTFSSIETKDNSTATVENTIALSCSDETNFADTGSNTYTLSMDVSDTDLTLTATTNYQGTESTLAVNWTIESGDDPTGCLSVNGGVLTATQAGTATVVATSTDDGSLVASCVVTITDSTSTPALTDGVTLKVDDSEVTSATTLDLVYGGSDITAVASVVSGGVADSGGVTWASGDESIATVTDGVVSIADNAVPGSSTTITAKSVTDTNLTQTFNVEVKFGAFTLANLTAWNTAGYTPPTNQEWVITTATLDSNTLSNYLTNSAFVEACDTDKLTITFTNATSAPSTFMKDVKVIDVINMPSATVIYQSAFNSSSVTEVYAPLVTELIHSNGGTNTVIAFRSSSIETLTLSSQLNTATLGYDAFIISNSTYTIGYDLILVGAEITNSNINTTANTITAESAGNNTVYAFDSITYKSSIDE